MADAQNKNPSLADLIKAGQNLTGVYQKSTVPGLGQSVLVQLTFGDLMFLREAMYDMPQELVRRETFEKIEAGLQRSKEKIARIRNRD